MSIDLAFTAADWERVMGAFDAWWAHELGRPLVHITGKVETPGTFHDRWHRFISNYGLEVPAEQVIADVTANLEATRFYGDAYPRWFVNFGPGIAAGFLGAVVHTVPDTVWFEPPGDIAPADLSMTYQSDNPWWRRVVDLTAVAVAQWGQQVAVSHTDIGGNLDILASFRTTQNLLTDLYDAPEELDRLVGETTTQWLRYYDELDAIIRPGCRGTTCWAPIWSRDTTYMLQCDFSYMISPAMFERFVLPDLEACCAHLEHGFYHLDGSGQIAHLDMLLAMPRLRGIQWIPGDGAPPPHEWLDLLKRIIDGGKLCQLFVSAEGARTIVRNLGGKGFLLAIQEEMTAEEAEAFLRLLAQEDISS